MRTRKEAEDQKTDWGQLLLGHLDAIVRASSNPQRELGILDRWLQVALMGWMALSFLEGVQAHISGNSSSTAGSSHCGIRW